VAKGGDPHVRTFRPALRLRGGERKTRRWRGCAERGKGEALAAILAKEGKADHTAEDAVIPGGGGEWSGAHPRGRELR